MTFATVFSTAVLNFSNLEEVASSLLKMPVILCVIWISADGLVGAAIEGL